MYWRGTARINDAGHLEIGGCDAVDLVKQYGTPLYVIDERAVRDRCRAYVDGFAKHYPNSEVIYAGKAFLTMGMCRIIEEEGLSLDVVSGGELYTALKAGFPPKRIYFHGNNKSPAEVRMGIEAGVGRFVVDSEYETDLLNTIAAEVGRKVDIYLRITPGVEAHTHSYIQTGQLDSKFGFGLANDVALHAVERTVSREQLNLVGFHCHIGSQIFDLESFQVVVELMVQFISDVQNQFGVVISELDLGGGLGIRYNEEDDPVSQAEYAAVVGAAVESRCARLGVKPPKILIEPGRSIVGEAGTTLYTVGSTKDIPGVRRYVAVDGGMGDNPRVALYQAKYEAVVANKVEVDADQVVSIAGKCCESGDMLIWDLAAPELVPGDVLAMFSTGAYNYSMASNYNRIPRPAVVTVLDDHSELLVRRESYEDLVANDVVPERLRSEAAVSQRA